MKRFVLVLATALGLAAPAHTATSRDAAIIARAISFVQGGPTGEVSIAVIEGAGADAAIAAFGAGASAGALTLKARKVAVSALASSGAKVIFVPEGQAANQAAIASAAKSLRAITVSTDMECARSGNCVLGVAAEPRVEILVNRAAATANGVAFQPAFRVMIREI
jgi:hypothetical protein